MSMILYRTLGVSDVVRAAHFYDAVLAPLGYLRRTDPDTGWAGGGSPYDEGVSFWNCPPFDGAPATPGNGAIVAFRAASAAEVRAFQRAALQSDGRDESAPGLRLNYEPGFYAAHVRDLDGNKLACVFHRYEPATDEA